MPTELTATYYKLKQRVEDMATIMEEAVDHIRADKLHLAGLMLKHSANASRDFLDTLD